MCRQWGRKLTNRLKPHRDHRDISLYIKLVHANKMHATPYCKINYFFLASLIVPLISCYYFVKCVIITQARKYNVFNSCVILTENKFWLEVLLKISTWIFIETPSMEAESSMWQKDRQEGRHTDRQTDLLDDANGLLAMVLRNRRCVLLLCPFYSAVRSLYSPREITF